MKLFIILSLTFILNVFADDSNKEWESLDLEKTHIQEMEEQQRRQYEDREGDLQIQEEEEDIIPLESEDSRYFNNPDSKED